MPTRPWTPDDFREPYDVAIAGGGLAGLSLSILLGRQGYKVIVFEKEQYPFHKVCGEYISMESWEFLKSLGLDLETINPSRISRLQLSSVGGTVMDQPLPLGGFGISRHLLDNALAGIARQRGVTIEENTRVNDIIFQQEDFLVHTSTGSYRSKVAVGSFGKKSNLDVKWKRPFIFSKRNKLNNFIGVKYHIRAAFASDTIALFNFPGGYCGIVKIEKDRYNLCYLTTAATLKKAGGNIKMLEQHTLSINPLLKQLLDHAEFIDPTPLTISQVSFEKKSLVANHVLMAGDSAGMITPLCGNGMSMALHSGKLLAGEIESFLNGRIGRREMENAYQCSWEKTFAGRLRVGRAIQRLFSNQWLASLSLSILKLLPPFAKWVIRQTHGKPF